MPSFLMVGQPALGHLNPLMTLGGQLRSEGHRVVFALGGPKATSATVQERGFEVARLGSGLWGLGFLALPYLSGLLETMVAMTLFTREPEAHARALLPVLDELRPDAIAADFAFPGAFLAAEARALPYASIYHAGLAYPGPGIPPFGSGWPIGQDWGWRGRVASWGARLLHRSIQGTLARARRRLDLAVPSADGLFWSSPWVTLVLTSEETEAPRDPLPPRTFFVGPCFAGRPSGPSESFPWERLDGSRPRVYVSLGTVFNRKPGVFRKIFAAFSDGRHQLIVSAGGAYHHLSGLSSPDVLIFPRVPQVEVLPRVDAVISHGGNNTVNETLAAGKPLLVLPVGGEQGDNASRVVYLGAGLRADIRRFSPGEIRTGVERLLTEPKFALRAREIAQALARTEGPERATRFLLHLARERRPIERPPGYPSTVTRGARLPWEAEPTQA